MQTLRKEQKSKIECKLQILIVFQLLTCEENPFQTRFHYDRERMSESA